MAHIFEHIFRLIETCLTVCVLLASHGSSYLLSSWLEGCIIRITNVFTFLFAVYCGWEGWDHWQGKNKVGRCQDKARMSTHIYSPKNSYFTRNTLLVLFLPPPLSLSSSFFNLKEGSVCVAQTIINYIPDESYTLSAEPTQSPERWGCTCEPLTVPAQRFPSKVVWDCLHILTIMQNMI